MSGKPKYASPRYAYGQYYMRHYSQGRMCFFCLILKGRKTPITNSAKTFLCVKHARQLVSYLKRNGEYVESQRGQRPYKIAVHPALETGMVR